ncbi:hypothetical protein [Chryseobacterium sp.]|uniref:hypothetical protein n=1 Tax=Chryseobacterium sp. TaxID=1871047 RepID=UPI0025B7EC1F|nr:hypothetical protein [Chryseobacterium sp.]MBV8325309.1 hypothetical protein [Chryseobacterium sp.]
MASLFLTGCSKPEKQKVTLSEDSSTWMRDSLGCLQERNFDMAERLLLENTLENSSTEKFKTIFGKPNEINQDRNHTSFTYYVQSICSHHSIQKDSDKCFIVFTFKNNKLIDHNNACE